MKTLPVDIVSGLKRWAPIVAPVAAGSKAARGMTLPDLMVAVGVGSIVLTVVATVFLNSALSLYYYARVIWYMWVLDPPEGATRVSAGKAITFAIAIAFVMIWVTGIFAFPFISYLQGAAGTFFGI